MRATRTPPTGTWFDEAPPPAEATPKDKAEARVKMRAAAFRARATPVEYDRTLAALGLVES